MKGLTERQKQILGIIINFIETRGFPPTIREIGLESDICSLRGVTVNIDALIRKGHLKVNCGSSRAITVIRDTEGRSGSFQWVSEQQDVPKDVTL